jgi:hypothetical protein
VGTEHSIVNHKKKKMKTLFLGSKVKMSLPFVLIQLSRLAISVIALLFSLASFSQEVVFCNPQLASGNDRSDGAVCRFSNVTNNKQVMLNWATTNEKNVSHFVIEKGGNGIDFKEAVLIFTDGNSEILTSYAYRDALTANSPVIYYRLRIVGLDGKQTYSPVRTIHTSSTTKGQLELLAFPNPVVSELRITIPEGWQYRQVTYELYDGAGRLIKQVVNKNASQTEVFNMRSVTTGNYLIKVYTTEQGLVQHVIKS